MSDFKKLLERFGEHEQNLKELGDALVIKYPQSKNLIQLSQELAVAIEGLNVLRGRLGEAIHEAESQTALGADLETQMTKSEIYQKLSDRDRKKLSEYLIQQGAGLATDEELLAFIKKSLDQKSEPELLSEFSKAHILELGQAIMEEGTSEGNEFDAYQAGMEAIRTQLQDPAKREEIISDLAEVLLKESPATVVRLFFPEAFKQKDMPKLDVNPAPMLTPDLTLQPQVPEAAPV